MKTKKQVYELARSLDVVIDDNSDNANYDVCLWASDGYAFDCSSAQCARTIYFADGNKSLFWQHVWEDLNGGITKL